MPEQNAAPVPEHVTPTSSPTTADLGVLFRRGASAADCARALQSFGATVRARLQDGAAMAGHGAETRAERSGQLLSELVDRLPIRRAEELRREFGADPQLAAAHVIDEAATMARWLWTAAKAVPAPDVAVHAAKVVLHSAIEIRMVGELIEAHRDTDADAEATALPAIVAAWAGQLPGDPLRSAPPVVQVLVAQARRSLRELRGSDGRIKGILTRGREGGDIVRGLGERTNAALRGRPVPGCPSGTL